MKLRNIIYLIPLVAITASATDCFESGSPCPQEITISPTGSGALQIGSKTALFNVYTKDSTAAATIGRWQNNGNAVDFQGLKSRNATIGSHTTVQTGDQILQLSAHADDGTTYDTLVGSLLFSATGTVSTGIVPGKYQIILSDASGNPQNVIVCTSGGCSGGAQKMPQTYTATYNPSPSGSVVPGTIFCDNVTVTGITTSGGAVAANIGAVDPPTGCAFASARASATDTVRVCWTQTSAVTQCDVASSTWTFTQAQ